MKKHIIRYMIIAGLVISWIQPLQAQQVEFNLGLGYTGVNLNEWAGGAVTDWDQTLYHVSVQAYFTQGDTQVGAELGYTFYMWYTVPFFSGTREPSATSTSALVRFNLSETLFTELAAGFYFFGDWIDVGARGAIGWMLPLTEKISVPLKIQAGVVLDESTNLYPINITGGLSYTF